MEKSYWRDAYELFCERYRMSVLAKQSESEVLAPTSFTDTQSRLGRLFTPSDTPSNAGKRQKSSEKQFLQSTVVTGTPLLALPPRKIEGAPMQNLRFPKLSPDMRLTQYLRRKKLVTGLTPRIGRKHTLLSFDPLERSPPSSLIKTPKVKDGDIEAKPRLSKKPRMSGSQSPQRSICDLDKAGVATPRKSLELETVRELSRPQTIETKRTTEKTEDLNSSGILMTRKMQIASQAIRSSFNSASASEVPQSPSRPQVKKKRPKPVSIEVKPTPEQLVAATTALYVEFNHFLAASNGLIPLIPDFPYKFFVGPGNNSQLVCAIMKKRWYWTRVDSWQLADFVWTQNKQSSIVERLEKTSETAVAIPVKMPPKLPFALVKSKLQRQILSAERVKSGLSLITASDSYTPMRVIPALTSMRLYNRIERNYHLTSKKRLFLNMRSYYTSRGDNVFHYLPLTFLIQNGVSDSEFSTFERKFREGEAVKSGKEKPKFHNLWIVKPGENTNCGRGIHVSSSLDEIKGLIAATVTTSGRKRTYIVQKYIERPLLIHKRKFDIRCYGLISCFNGHVQGYFYHDGYLRTSSKEFSLKNAANRFVHLTNDAVQKKSEDYGKFESGNKMSYEEFQKYLEATTAGKVDFWRDLWPQIKKLMTDTFRAASSRLDPHRRRHTFEVLGYDFMIDKSFSVWLIEVNTNPCLALSSPYLARLIPTMLDNAFRVAIDPYFSEPTAKKRQGEWAATQFENRFEEVFSSLKDQQSAAGPEDVISADSEDSDDSEENEAN